jgi:rod shape determining protein RodA
MTPLLRKILGMNLVLLLSMLALTVYGVYAIYSATWMREETFLAEAWKKQTMWAGVGLAVYFITSLIDYRWLKWGAVPMYLAGLVSLVALKFYGTTTKGAQSWFNFGPVSFQPSQLAIIASIFAVALCLSQFRRLPPVVRIAMSGSVIAAPWILIFLQPDLGSALMWIPVYIAMLFLGGIPKRWMILLILLVLLPIPIAVNFLLKDHQRARLTTFWNQDYDPQGIGWQINQSLTAIGSGGWSGKGFKASNTLNELGFLPADTAHNDLIFSVLGEQHGFLGACGLLGAFALLVLTGFYVALCAEDLLGVLIATGVSVLIFTHVFQNIGMTIAMMPITGVPLPFISYGGSFLLSLMFGLGVVQSIWIHRGVKAKGRA